jgi:Protein of unknown function (DUF998)
MALATCFATAVERHRSLPADAMVPDPIFTSTHAITIDAPLEQVWPWIAQMGAGRAGWYSGDLIDNGGAPSARRVVPELQMVVPGDVMPAVPGATDAFVVAAVDPPRDLVLTVPDGHDGHAVAWEHALEPIDPMQPRISHKALLACGVLASLTYVASDIFASLRYAGYSFTDQAVSELFAIGAPTIRIVVPLFTLSSTLLAAFAFGVWTSCGHSRALRWLAIMIFANALNTLVLWNFFPMHMRGVPPTFTDAMHIVLAINPFVLLSVVFGMAAFKGWFRSYSAATALVLLVPAIFSLSYVSAVAANQPTP